MSTPENDLFRHRLVHARSNLRKMNQEELAKKAGLQPAAISHFETGSRKPSFDNLRKLAQALEVTTDYLLGKADDPEGVGDVNMLFRNEFNGLSADQREMTLFFIQTLKSKNTKSE
jgi:transcriptional regulator with XRE-family HTH domain